MTVVSRDPIAMSRAPITLKVLRSDRANAHRNASATSHFALAPKAQDRQYARRGNESRVTFCRDELCANCALLKEAMVSALLLSGKRPTCMAPARSAMDRVLIFSVLTLAVAGQVARPKPEWPGPRGPARAGLFTRNAKALR